MKLTQTYLADSLKVSKPFINRIVKAKQRPNWTRAKQLAEVTGTRPDLWLEGSEDEIKKALKKFQKPRAA